MRPDFLSSGNMLADRRYLYGQGLAADGEHLAAADILAQALELAPHWPAGWFALGEARARALQPDEAAAAFHKALECDGADALGAGLRLAQLGRAPVPASLPAAYVRGLFDQYAPRFDAHLKGALNYTAPEQIVAALESVCAALQRPCTFAHALDLGCGTGLMAKALGARAAHLTGVDLSPAMIEKASAASLYQDLHAGEMIEFFSHTHSASFDLILAADVLVYAGDLAPFCAGTARTLTRGGLAAFTLQHHAGEGFILGSDLRFAHSENYLRAMLAAAGLHPEIITHVSTREDAGCAVPGLLCIATPAP